MIPTSQVDRFVDVASSILGASRVLTDHATCIAHSYDAYLFESTPRVVVFPQTTNDVRALVEAANSTGLPYVARGAGTGYAGGALAVSNGVVISLQDMNRILEFNDEEGWVLAQPGVITGTLADEVRTRGWRYPPDPSSFRVSTIGGNIATNAGGPHCLGYGVTSNYVLEIEVVTPEGGVVRLGGQTSLQDGLDLRGLYIGSEGTFGIVTSARLRLIRQPPCVHTYIATFPNIEAAISAMESIFRQAIPPIALELIWSALIPTVNGCEARGETFMFIELEGPPGDVQSELAGIAACVSEHMGRGLAKLESDSHGNSAACNH
jgi:glycolate oxidase